MTDANQLEEQIAATRLKLTAALADLRDSLTPQHILTRVSDAIRSPTASGTARATALGLALVACGAGWALFRHRKTPADRVTGPTFQAQAFLPQALRLAVAILMPLLAHKVATAQEPTDWSLPEPFDSEALSDREIRDSRSAERGRQADAPSEIPVSGWKDILMRLLSNISEHRIFAIGGGVTFYTILAIFPAIAALVSLYGLFADAGSIASHLDALSGILPGGAIDVLRDQMLRLTSKGQGSLGLTFAVSLLTSLWSANAGIKAFFDALNIVYGEREKRNFFTLNALSLLFTTGAIAFLLIALGAVVVLPVALNAFGVANDIDKLIPMLRWPLMFVIVSLALSVLYRFGPSRAQAKWRWISWGSTLAAFLWLGVSILFSWYTANFGSYNATYGSLGAAVGFMVWIWLSSIVFLLGAELDAEMEHQTAHDTTVGAATPIGMRHAAVADTLGRPAGS